MPGRALKSPPQSRPTRSAHQVSEVAAPGLFGKLPSRGDFVVRRLDPGCRIALDAWLQNGMLTSRRALGDGWLHTYLNAPIWRFACAPGVCGAWPLAGVMMPSVDRVGRYFPLVLAAQLDGWHGPQTLITTASAWFDALHALALQALESDMDLNDLDRAVEAAGLPMDCPATDEPAAMAGVIFWIVDDGGVPEVFLHAETLPAPQSFSSLLSLHWPSGGWERSLDTVSGSGRVPEYTQRPATRLLSAGRTHAGTRRTLNQDALLIRADLGVWAVADGVGGHESGEVASRSVIEHLSQLLPPLTLEQSLDDVHELLEEANTQLCSRAGAISDDAIVASTVAVLTVADGRAGIVWSGDCRVYRLRAGGLECLTRDHADAFAVRHAIGADPTLVTERTVHVTWPGDRYLLCSDGLPKVLTEAEITLHVERDTPEDAAAALIDDALVAGARDNVTAIVVHLPRP